jgi:dihydrofolate reductase
MDAKVGFVANSLDSALQLIQDQIPNFGEIFVIGGGILYAEAINHPDCNKIYCTEILHYFIVDDVDMAVAYFPQINKEVYELTETTPIITDNDMSFRFNVYLRSSP